MAEPMAPVLASAKARRPSKMKRPVAKSEPSDNANETPADSAKVAPPAISQVCATLGAATWLATHSRVHRHLFLADLEWLLLPPIMLNQTRLYHDQQRPLAFVCWAFLSESVEERIKAGVPRLQPPDWKSGDRPWIIETIAPFAKPEGVEEIIKELTTSVFKGVRPRLVGEKD